MDYVGEKVDQETTVAKLSTRVFENVDWKGLRIVQNIGDKERRPSYHARMNKSGNRTRDLGCCML
jgi:hypothetical protein